MSKIEELIDKLCPDGVEYVSLWSITIWDKKFRTVDRNKQKKVYKYNYFLVDDLNSIIVKNGDVKILTTNTTDLYTSEEYVGEYVVDREVVVIPGGGNPNVQYHNGKFITTDNRVATSIDTTVLDNKFLYYWMKNNLAEIGSYYRGATIKHPYMAKILDMKIPLPLLEVQREIVRILDNFTMLVMELTTELAKRKKQYEYYRDELLSFDVDIPKETLLGKLMTKYCPDGVEYIVLGDIGSICMCKRVFKSQTNDSEGVPFYKIRTFGQEADSYISWDLFNEYKEKYSYPKKGEVLISVSGTIGKRVIFDGEPAYFQDSNIVWISNNEKKVLNKYLYYYFELQPWNIQKSGTIARLYNENIARTKIPVPPLDVQNIIVEILDNFEAICYDLNNGLPAEIAARQKQYEYYRDKLLNFKEK